ncbi:MAG: SRPBCC family protein [Candidatus Eremiobacteraeota bacterium]|nr:SRPBCC family protein [Candidatus Eremiobacteraeota bacterium]
MGYVKSSINVKADPEEVYKLARNMEEFPRYMPDVKEITVLERGENYTVTNWITEVEGTPITWKEKEIFDNSSLTISYRLIEGDLEKFQGEWHFIPVDEGTKVTLDVDYDFGVPAIEELMGPILKKKLEENCNMMLSSLKKKIES